MKSFSFLAIIAVAALFIFSCSKKSDCASNNTGSILFHNDAFGAPDTIYIFSGSVKLGYVKKNDALTLNNIPVGKNVFTFKVGGGSWDSDSISVSQCNTSHYSIPIPLISDKRLKKNIISLHNVLANIGKLNIYSYEYTTPENYTGFLPHGLHYGFMAQELKKVYPAFVQLNSNGYYSVNYQEMIPILAKGIQEQQTQIDELKKEVAELKTIVKNQQAISLK